MVLEKSRARRRLISAALMAAFVGINAASTTGAPQIGGLVARAQPIPPTGRLTVQAFNALAPDAKRAYALGFVDGVFAAEPGLTSMLRPQFMPCVTGLTNDQVVDTIVKAVDALEPASADSFVRVVANRALITVCPSRFGLR
jgi:hypothetical protein